MLGVSAPDTQFHEFDGVPAVVVKRYDRDWETTGVSACIRQTSVRLLALGPSGSTRTRADPESHP
ncbi:hypothetical protein AUL38_07985 [Leucobacter sp. G161]|nr:hypothetical protein AUL38_07985 [Leucobacter sp. G161]